MRSEQDTVRETTEQTDFTQAHPEEEALKHRHRDAETTLNERMGNNHRSTASERAEPNSAQLHGTQLTDNADQIDTDHANTDDINHDDVNQKDRA
jgi:acyl-CoA dehydrogenase